MVVYYSCNGPTPVVATGAYRFITLEGVSAATYAGAIDTIYTRRIRYRAARKYVAY